MSGVFLRLVKCTDDRMFPLPRTILTRLTPGTPLEEADWNYKTGKIDAL